MNTAMNDNKFKHNLLLRIAKGINLILEAVPFAVVYYLYYSSRLYTPYHKVGNYVVLLVFLAIYFTMGRIYESFHVSLSRISEMIYSQSLALIVTDIFMYLVFLLLIRHLANPLPLLGCLGTQILISTLWCTLAHQWYFGAFPARKTVLIYDNRKGIEQLISEYGLTKKFDIIRMGLPGDCIKENFPFLKDAEAVFICGVHSHERNIILKECIYRGIDVYVIPRIGDTIMSGAKAMHMFHLPMLRIDRYNPNPEFVIEKRMMDILVSSILIILTSPIFLVIAIAIKMEDGGPVFYKQCRLTKNGKKFNVIKFRSMRVDAEKDGVARLSTGDKDDRITRVGKFIRKVRIDELPQFLNILKGDMSIVGPRPERPEIAEEYMKELPEFNLRLQAKAGLTGYAQVFGKYNTTPYDKLMMDLMYIAHPNLAEDLKIIFATIKILFLPESTEGVAVGATTAMDYENAADSTENDAETVAK